MQFLLFYIFIGFSGLNIENVESRRVIGSTHVVEFPKFYPRPHKVNHKFLPKFEYTVFDEKVTTTSLLPTTTPSTTTTTTVTTPTTTTVLPITAPTTTTVLPTTTTTAAPIHASTVISTTTTTTPSTTPKPIFPDFRTSSTSITTSEASAIPSTEATVTPSSRDSSFDWFGAFIVLFITCAAITFFVIRRKCSSPSGTYKIPKINLVPQDYYVRFCKLDDDFIEIHARALYGPSYITSIENQNFEEDQTDETCL